MESGGRGEDGVLCYMWRGERGTKKTNKHESDDMLVNYGFIICHDTQIYYDGSFFHASPFFNAYQTFKNICGEPK